MQRKDKGDEIKYESSSGQTQRKQSFEEKFIKK